MSNENEIAQLRADHREGHKMTKEYMLSESQIRDLTSQLTAKDERIAELEGALADSIRWMECWLDRDECDCVELPHTCGRQRVERDLSKIKAVLGDAPKEEPIWSPTAGYGGDAPNEGGGASHDLPR